MADRFKFAEVRQEVIEMLKKDLLGPSSENEILNQNPRFEYIVGMLAPQTSENDSNEQEVDGDASFEGDADYTAGEDDDNEPVFTNRFKTPSSIGISFYLESSTKSFNVDVTWGDYTKASDKTTNKEGKKVDVSTYTRHPQKETVVIDLQSDVFAHLVGFLHGRGGHHLAGPIYAGAVDDPLFLGTIQAGGKAPETLQGTGHGSTVIVRAGHDEIELLVRNVRPPGKAAVDDDLHLCINGVEVHWACHHDNICRLHCVQNFAHVIVQGTLAAVVAAIIAGIAGHNLLAAHEDLLHFVAALLRTTHKLTAQQVGVAVLAGTAGQNQDFLHRSFLL